MSYQATEWALRWAPIPQDERGKPSASSCAHVLVALSYPAGEEGQDAFPSVETIVEWTHLSERTVRAALGRLHAKGLIKPGNQNHPLLRHLRPDRRPKVWDLELKLRRAVVDTDQDGVQSVHPVDLNEVQPLHPVPVDGVQPRPHGVQSLPERGAATAPKESLKSPVKLQEQQPRASAEVVDDQQARGLVTEWRSAHEAAGALRSKEYYRKACAKVAAMLADDCEPRYIAAALLLWDQRPELHSAGILPNLYDDAVRIAAARPQQSAEPTKRLRKAMGALHPDDPFFQQHQTSPRVTKALGFLAPNDPYLQQPTTSTPDISSLFGQARAITAPQPRPSTTDQRVADIQALKQRMKDEGRFDDHEPDPAIAIAEERRKRMTLAAGHEYHAPEPTRPAFSDFIEGEFTA